MYFIRFISLGLWLDISPALWFMPTHSCAVVWFDHNDWKHHYADRLTVGMNWSLCVEFISCLAIDAKSLNWWLCVQSKYIELMKSALYNFSTWIRTRTGTNNEHNATMKGWQWRQQWLDVNQIKHFAISIRIIVLPAHSLGTKRWETHKK